jgi:hypothetical protein
MNGMKFRVWQEKSRVMVYPDDVGTPVVLAPDGRVRKLEYNPKKNEYDLLPLDPPYTILFWTMYQDRYGKEIYEGDIVKDVIGGNYYLIQFDPVAGFYGVKLPAFSDERGINYLAQRVVVVGNIKENIDLLHFAEVFEKREKSCSTDATHEDNFETIE